MVSGIGHPHAAHELGDDPVALEGLVDLWPAAMDDDRVDPQRLEEDHIEGEALLQVILGHGVTAVLDDEGLAGEALDVGERFHQYLGFVDQFLHGNRLIARTGR